MILDILAKLNQLNIVLASGSPRRRELLERLGLRFQVRVSKFEENLDKSSFPDAIAYNAATSKGKMTDILENLKDEKPDVVITCDTIVVPCSSPKSILEKAESKEDAARMIRGLAGTSHYVYSTLLVHFTKLDRTEERVVRTTVTMAPLTESMIAAYVEHPSAWQGKAGAYGIQDLASSFIEGIEGDYYNVMGLPVCEFCKLLRDTVNDHPEIFSS